MIIQSVYILRIISRLCSWEEYTEWKSDAWRYESYHQICPRLKNTPDRNE